MAKGIPGKGSSENEGKAWGKGQFANMPTESMMKQYPTEGSYMDLNIDDTITRLTDDSKQVKRGERKNLDRGMY